MQFNEPGSVGSESPLCVLSDAGVIWAAVSRRFIPVGIRISAPGVSSFKTLDQIISTTADCV